MTSTQTQIEQSKTARNALLYLGEIQPQDLSTDEILNLELGLLSSLPKKTVTAFWRVLLQRTNSLAKHLKFLNQTWTIHVPPSAWKAVIEHPSCTVTKLSQLYRKVRDHHTLNAIDTLIFRQKKWPAQELWNAFKRIRRDRRDFSTEGWAESLILREDCPTSVLLEIAAGNFSQASGWATSALVERPDCPIDFLLQQLFEPTPSIGCSQEDRQELTKQISSALNKHTNELKQRAGLKLTAKSKQKTRKRSKRKP